FLDLVGARTKPSAKRISGGRGVLSTPLKILIFAWCWPLKPRFRLRPFEATVGLRLKPPICRNPACACRATATCPRPRLAAPPQGNPDSGGRAAGRQLAGQPQG